MTGRQKIESALSPSGTNEIPAVICYEGIYIRDHWEQLTSCPWWYQYSPDIELQLQWHRDVITRTGQDWFYLPFFYSREERKNLFIEINSEDVFQINKHTDKKYKLSKPQVAGWSESGGLHSHHPQRLIDTFEEIDSAIYVSPDFDPKWSIADGRNDLALRLLDEFKDLYPISHVGSPLWHTYQIWGFEGMMTMIAEHPDLVKHACKRFLIQSIHSVQQNAMLGANGIWIEECFTDMISPKAFEEINVSILQTLVEEIRKAGMKSIYYYCGDPSGKWDQILAVGADAVSLEESKKGFVIDIDDVVDRINGRCTVLGNLDAIHLLPDGTEDELRAEITRQIQAGRRNNGKFIMSIGSPVTPGTTVDRVRLYCNIVH
ncbi:MAG: Uroporphyrinogen deCOase protein [Candidatus Poribacteria bacterium]|nr:Uroporphyrinogen deCOase protein [Candidatus Poribacteria bacterium]